MSNALLFWVIVTAVLFGCFTSIVAGEKHRNALGWFVIGFIYPLLGLILAIVLPANPAPETEASPLPSGKSWWRAH